MKRNWVDGLNEELSSIKLNRNFSRKLIRQRQIHFRRGLVAACVAFIIMAGSAFALMNNNGKKDNIYLANTLKPSIQATDAPNIAIKNDRLYRYSESGKFGYIDSIGKVVIEAQFDYAMSALDDVTVVAQFNEDKTSRKLALLDRSGNVTGYDFNYIGAFVDGLAPAMKLGGKFGAINATGEWVIEPTFESIGNFSSGFALATKGEKTGYIDTKGEWKLLLDNEYEVAFDSSDGNRWVKAKEGFGLIKEDGTWIVSPKYDPLYAMPNGSAVVGIKGKIGIVNAQGEPVLEPTFDGYDHSGFGMAVLVDKDGQGVLFDENGQKLLGGKVYSRISIVNETMVLIAMPYKSVTYVEDIYWFLCDLNGNKLMDSPVEYAEDLGNGYVKITSLLNGQSGQYIVNKSGEQVVDPQFDKIISFDEKVLVGTKLISKNEADNTVTIKSVVYDVVGNKAIHESSEAILSAVEYEKVNLYTAPDGALIYGGETIPYINILESLDD